MRNVSSKDHGRVNYQKKKISTVRKRQNHSALIKRPNDYTKMYASCKKTLVQYAISKSTKNSEKRDGD